MNVRCQRKALAGRYEAETSVSVTSQPDLQDPDSVGPSLSSEIPRTSPGSGPNDPGIGRIVPFDRSSARRSAPCQRPCN
jgi:hypothetical protein